MPYIDRIVNKIKKMRFSSEEIEKLKNINFDTPDWYLIRKKIEPVFNELRIHDKERDAYAERAIPKLKRMAKEGLISHEESTEHQQETAAAIRTEEAIKRMERIVPDHFNQPRVKSISPTEFEIVENGNGDDKPETEETQSEVKATFTAKEEDEIKRGASEFEKQEEMVDKFLKGENIEGIKHPYYDLETKPKKPTEEELEKKKKAILGENSELFKKLK